MLRPALVIAALLLSSALAPPASASDPVICKVRDPSTGECIIEIELPSPVVPISNPGPTPEPGRGEAGPAPTCQNARRDAIPCTLPDLGSWSGARGCYVALADPQPPATDPIWAGNPDGAIYQCYVPPGYLPGTGLGISNLFWSAAPPDAVTLTPQQAAEIVVAGMDLRAIDIGLVPEPGAGSVGLVGLPVWMWTEETANTWGPLARTATAGGVSITATANVQRVIWDMGDGTTVTCTTSGTPYEDRYGDQMSPDCGHRYSETSVGRPGNAYPVSATSHWQVDWTGGGASGQIPLELIAQTQVQIGELQVLVSR
jgi:hypothetical protein